MIGYMDRTFCISPDCKDECGRRLTKEIREAADKWWGDEGAPIAVGCFCGGDLNTEANKIWPQQEQQNDS